MLFGSAAGKGMTMELFHVATYCRVMNNVTCLVAAFAGVMELRGGEVACRNRMTPMEER